MTARVLLIAGSDSGGGAGIQADLKTVTALGAYAATALTALTAQNTLGVHGIVPVDPAFVALQMRVVLEDIGAGALKTGMLHSRAVIEAVVETARAHAKGVPLVADPVMVAKGGASLLQPDAVAAVREVLFPAAFVVTPNLPETEAILGTTVADVTAMRRAARSLCELGARAALVKGGHLPGDALVDVLFSRDDGEHLFEGERIHTTSTHGTGCTLASAVAAGLAAGMPLPAAVDRARRYVRAALLAAPGLGKGHGPLGHGHTVRPFE
ncbi:MAG: bifunctional hydroxymethylpyrimidine kinase/phosphomethylpyrimidine kinase [Polyangiaceae bacterium]